MKVLIIGSGGREHALAWKCAQTADAVIVAPGNAGTAREQKVRNAQVSSDDIDALIELAKKERVNLTIVGPEAPLVAGVVDRFEEAGLPCGPASEDTHRIGIVITGPPHAFKRAPLQPRRCGAAFQRSGPSHEVVGQIRASRRPASKAHGRRILVIFNRHGTQPAGMDRRPEWVDYFCQTPKGSF